MRSLFYVAEIVDDIGDRPHRRRWRRAIAALIEDKRLQVLNFPVEDPPTLPRTEINDTVLSAHSQGVDINRLCHRAPQSFKPLAFNIWKGRSSDAIKTGDELRGASTTCAFFRSFPEAPK